MGLAVDGHSQTYEGAVPSGALVDCFTMYAQQYVTIYAIRSQSQDLYLSQRNTEMLEILKV